MVGSVVGAYLHYVTMTRKLVFILLFLKYMKSFHVNYFKYIRVLKFIAIDVINMGIFRSHLSHISITFGTTKNVIIITS